jgi:hypothetical protein
MKRVVIGAVVGYVVSMLLIATLGPAWGCGILGLTFGSAWVGHSDRSRWMVGRLLELAEQYFGCAKAAADQCGVAASRWSEWRAGTEQASLSRLAELPDAVWNAWSSEWLEGQGNVVIESGRVADMTQAVRALTAVVEARETFTFPRQRSA